MSLARLALPIAIVLSCSAAAENAAQTTMVTTIDLHVDKLRPGKSTYLVYMHGVPGSGAKHAVLTTSTIKREQMDGVDAWVIDQEWEGESGIVHTARTVHAAHDLSTLAQTSAWNWPGKAYTTIIQPKRGQGRIEGEVPAPMREKIEAGFATMRDGWWFNWHSDLALLPLLPFEKGGTLRLHLFDVGMEAAKDVDYIVLGSRTLQGGDGERHDCWLVETDSGSPGSGNFQRFWIDKQHRIVLKEEDVFNGNYRSKILLAVPAITEFPAPLKSASPKPNDG